MRQFIRSLGEWRAAQLKAETCEGKHLQCFFFFFYFNEVWILWHVENSVCKWSLWFYHGNRFKQNRHTAYRSKVNTEWHFFPSWCNMLLEGKQQEGETCRADRVSLLTLYVRLNTCQAANALWHEVLRRAFINTIKCWERERPEHET